VKHAASGEAQVLVVCAQDSVALSEEMALLHELMVRLPPYSLRILRAQLALFQWWLCVCV
jgi:hypothetical protein